MLTLISHVSRSKNFWMVQYTFLSSVVWHKGGIYQWQKMLPASCPDLNWKWWLLFIRLYLILTSSSTSFICNGTFDTDSWLDRTIDRFRNSFFNICWVYLKEQGKYQSENNALDTIDVISITGSGGRISSLV